MVNVDVSYFRDQMSIPAEKYKQHIPQLDGWRGMAILLVLGGHFFKLPAQRLGVEVFFVLSGLLMSQVLFEDRVPLGTFYQRRIARVLPTFILFLAAVSVVSSLTLSRFPAGQMILNALFLQHYMPDGVLQNLSLPIGHLWSLNVEEHSYVFLSVIALFVRDTRVVRVLLSLAALGCIVSYALHARPGTEGIFRTECAAFPLLASAAMRLWVKDCAPSRTVFLVTSACFAVLVTVSRKLGGSIPIDYIAKTFCLAVLVNTLAAAPLIVQRALSVAWLRWFGVCSFSIYLWQQPFMHWVQEGRMNPFIALPCALAVGAASFYFFENPMRRLIRRLSPSPQAVAAVPNRVGPS